MRLIFDALVPSNVEADPCSMMIQTRTRCGESVLLVDRKLAQRRAADGDLSALNPILDLNIDTAHLPTCMGSPHETLALCQGLRSLGFKGPIEVAVPPHDVPKVLQGHDDLSLRDLPDIDTWDIDTYGPDWDNRLFCDGLVFSDAPTFFLRRAGLISFGTGSVDEWMEAINSFVEQCKQTFNENTPERARRIQIQGAQWFADQRKLNALWNGLVSRGMFIDTFRITTDVDFTTIATAAEEGVACGLHQGRTIHLEMDPGLIEGSMPGLSDALGSALGLQSLASLEQWVKGSEQPSSTLRNLDDKTRIVAFQALNTIREQRGLHEPAVLATIEEQLGPAKTWIEAYHRHIRTPAHRLVIIPTWRCELRCTYCHIKKQDGREMSQSVIDQSVELLFSAPSKDLELAFFGGEPLLRWDMISPLCRRVHDRALSEGRNVKFQITTNCWTVTEPMLDELSQYNTYFQLSIDGDAETQNEQRKARLGGDSYARSAANKLSWFVDRDIHHAGFMVVPPEAAPKMGENFQHLIDLGFRNIQLNYALGAVWTDEARKAFGQGLYKIGQIIEETWAKGIELQVTNLKETRKHIRNNPHVTVDHDGAIYGGSLFLVHRGDLSRLPLGHLSDNHGWHRYMVDGLNDDQLLDSWTLKGTVMENKHVGAVMMSFVEWMVQRHPDRLTQARPMPSR